MTGARPGRSASSGACRRRTPRHRGNVASSDAPATEASSRSCSSRAETRETDVSSWRIRSERENVTVRNRTPITDGFSFSEDGQDRTASGMPVNAPAFYGFRQGTRFPGKRKNRRSGFGQLLMISRDVSGTPDSENPNGIRTKSGTVRYGDGHAERLSER